MMMENLNGTSNMAPRAMRMSRIGKNSTSTSQTWQSFMHVLHNKNVSFHNNHDTSSNHTSKTNSNIGSLLERFRKNINQGLHSGSNNTSSNNNSSALFANGNNNTGTTDGKFPRLSFFWEKFVEGFGSENKTNHTTTMVATTMREWFNGKQ